ncbi:hypothetical protein IFR05_017282, partial [Cadophora sp. M221]
LRQYGNLTRTECSKIGQATSSKLVATKAFQDHYKENNKTLTDSFEVQIQQDAYRLVKEEAERLHEDSTQDNGFQSSVNTSENGPTPPSEEFEQSPLAGRQRDAASVSPSTSCGNNHANAKAGGQTKKPYPPRKSNTSTDTLISKPLPAILCLDNSPTTSPHENISLAQRISSVNSQQERLLRDQRVSALLRAAQSAIESHPKTHYAHVAPQIIKILQKGSAARTSLDPEHADFLALNVEELDDWMENGTGDKIILLRDRPWVIDRPKGAAGRVLSDASHLEKDLQIDIQDFGVEWSSKDPAVRKGLIQEAIQRLAKPTNMPINALNLQCYSPNLTPPPIANHCDTLLNATTSASFKATKIVQGRDPDVGKEYIDVVHKFATDIRACISFQILGQAGAFSPWHIDNLGVTTWLTLEPNDTYAAADVIKSDKSKSQKFNNFYWTADDESVLKLWAVVLPSKEERPEAEAEFVRHGEDWIPPARWVRIIALTRFDTLVMPPGTIHAPITITDCLFRGGMAMQKRLLKRTFDTWTMCARNPHVTNEGRPRQAPAILDYLRELVLACPADCGYDPQDFDEQAFKDTCGWIASGGTGAMRCACQTGCTAERCTCYMSGQRCGSYCHGGKMKGVSCSNLCGWQEK